MNLIIGIPAFNEEKNIAGLITQLKKITNKIIVCNDGSSDLTSKIAEEMGVTVLNHEKNLRIWSALHCFFQLKDQNIFV